MTEIEIANISFFTKEEIENTGALLEDVSVDLFLRLQILRAHLNRRILLLENGLTTGKHSAYQHAQGLACDFTLHPHDGDVHMKDIFVAATNSIDFKGFGAYWNGAQYSFHVDIRDTFSEWGAIKKNNKWLYFSLFKDLTMEGVVWSTE